MMPEKIKNFALANKIMLAVVGFGLVFLLINRIGSCVDKKQGVFSLSLVLLLSQLYRRGKAKSWRLGANGPDLLQLQECV